MVRVVAFAGSAREQSFNKKLVLAAMAGAEEAGAKCTFVDLRDYSLPIYDGDVEAAGGLPENAVRLRRVFSRFRLGRSLARRLASVSRQPNRATRRR